MRTGPDRAWTGLPALRRQIAGLETLPAEPHGTIALGLAEADARLGGGLARGGVHEVFEAAPGDAGAATGFVAALAMRACGSLRSILWVRQAFAGSETGGLHAPGLAELGADPGRLILVTAAQPQAAIRAGAEGVRCPALGAVVIEPWGAPKVLDLTAVRRLSLAAARSGVTVFLLRRAAEPAASPAQTRWSVRAVPSQPLAASAPGHPAFEISLLRQRAGIAGFSWRVEWDRDQRIFRGFAPASRPVAAVPADRPAPARMAEGGLRLAG